MDPLLLTPTTVGTGELGTATAAAAAGFELSSPTINPAGLDAIV